ncbi:glutamate-5-semialdehyde dehydrogenase [Papillibacter cinnamivorans]|uniref:Gamma-glutamyl phosphate reductase n=1 Tax=Papillibacter cinnamivorans DSM 12816 TaxID=1122930 RepID=A0A1W2A773_9FIRM|nr:glutamate-5-semialdehyde dehydrogenase [Papillibacter cinnamivorans DSM 12816]
MTEMERMGAAAKAASYELAVAGAAKKNRALSEIAEALKERSADILAANAEDMEKARAGGMSKSLQDRLKLSTARIDGMVEGVLQVAALEDPVGSMIKMTTRPNGLIIGKRRVPLGVIGIIYEARPNVTVDAAVLCLKSGNAVILRGGSDAAKSNAVLTRVMREAVEKAGLPADCICSVSDTSRKSAVELMGLTEYLDVLIPRGGAGLIKSVTENSKVPVIETGVGNCHVYVDCDADLQMGAEIIYNAKCSRPSVCNAAETLLVSRAVAWDFLPMAKMLLDKDNVELRGCPITREILGDCVIPATHEDYYTEFLDYILAVKVVNDAEEAIRFINKHSSGHSEAIVTNNYFTAQKFLNEVDSAAVYVNASTRFTDGSEFGLGAEIGISTQKMHARGPMGLEELTSSKFVIYGEGQIR